MNITIIGAGIGGLTTALALANKGHNVALYERRSAPASPGAGYVLWPNAMFVLAELGLASQVINSSARLTHMDRYNQLGHKLTGLDLARLEQLMGYGSYAILRTDFLALLLEAVQARSIQLHFNCELTQIIKNDDEGVRALFSNGQECTADLLVGVDGRMDSSSRQYLLGDNQPCYQGFANWVGYAETELLAAEPFAVSDYWGLGERFGIVRAGEKKFYWAAGAAIAHNSPLFAEIKNSQRASNTNTKMDLLKRFAQWPAAINQLIDATDAHRINAILVHDIEPQAPWHQGRVVLSGDAAHASLPTSGQGASQALEDSWQLARCIDDCNGNNMVDLTQRLQQFEQLRFAKTASITRSARQLAQQIFSLDPNVCTQRDYRARNSNPEAAISGMASFWSQGLPLHMNPGI